MTVEKMKKKLEELMKQGFGKDVVIAWDGDTDTFVPVTGIVYGVKGFVELCTDDHDDEVEEV